MAKRRHGNDLINWIMYGIMSVVIFIIITVGNLFNYNIIYQYGFNQYISNITNIQQSSYSKLNKELILYDSVKNVKNLEKVAQVNVIPKNTIVEVKGTIDKDFVSWIAVHYFDKTNEVYGYIFSDGENKLLTSVTSDEVKNYKDKQFQVYISKVRENYKIIQALTTQEKQISQENNKLNLLYSINNINYYYDAENESKIKEIYEMYCSSNFKTIMLNTSNTYNPEVDGVYSEDIITTLLNSIYFKIISLILLVILFKTLYQYYRAEKCMQCGSRNIYTSNIVVINEKYEYENKDGSPDKRKKHNRVMQIIEVHKDCDNCNDKWYYEDVRYK